jgi:hypothetical protein
LPRRIKMPRWLETIFIVVIMAIVVCMLFMALLQTSGCSAAPAAFKLEDLDADTDELEDLDADTDELEDLDADTDELEDLDADTDELEDLDADTAELEDLDADTAELEDLDTDTAELEDSGVNDCDPKIAEIATCGPCFDCDLCRDGSGYCEREDIGQLAAIHGCEDRPIFCPTNKVGMNEDCSCVLCCGE